MRELLVPILGEDGALAAQIAITAVVVLALIALVYWLMRRISGFRMGGVGRGRVARLALVDAMAVDNRRRLVLVRRDNVEHLILIGGPSDVVVEPSIARRPRVAPMPARGMLEQPGEPGAVPMPPAARAVEDAARAPLAATIPFPIMRASPPRPPETPAPSAPRREAATAEAQRPAAESAASFAPLARANAAQPDPASAAATPARNGPPDTDAVMVAQASANGETANGSGGEGLAKAPETTLGGSALPGKLNELEAEMARLLGQITSERSS